MRPSMLITSIVSRYCPSGYGSCCSSPAFRPRPPRIPPLPPPLLPPRSGRPPRAVGPMFRETVMAITPSFPEPSSVVVSNFPAKIRRMERWMIGRWEDADAPEDRVVARLSRDVRVSSPSKERRCAWSSGDNVTGVVAGSSGEASLLASFGVLCSLGLFTRSEPLTPLPSSFPCTTVPSSAISFTRKSVYRCFRMPVNPGSDGFRYSVIPTLCSMLIGRSARSAWEAGAGSTSLRRFVGGGEGEAIAIEC
ncbi:hypothetical protein BDZ91DRAFT_717082 [Kalaharituber pfeilii]|nr:hypothetical protein BDZ91DRAFT_717082 [Kalaharituber pfeilii]